MKNWLDFSTAMMELICCEGGSAIDRDHADLERMLAEYWGQPNTQQLNIRIPLTAKRLIEKLARRKTVELSTLVRMWVVEGRLRSPRPARVGYGQRF